MNAPHDTPEAPRALLALDIATRTGFAVRPLDGGAAPTPLEAAGLGKMPKPLSGEKSFQAFSGGDLGPLYGAFSTWCADMVRVHRPHLFIFEAPLPPRVFHQERTARILLGLAALAEAVAYKMGVPLIREANVQDVKAHATGHRLAKKPEMIRACLDRGWNVAGHNEADALLLADFAAAMMAMNRPIMRPDFAASVIA